MGGKRLPLIKFLGKRSYEFIMSHATSPHTVPVNSSIKAHTTDSLIYTSMQALPARFQRKDLLPSEIECVNVSYTFGNG